MAAFLDFWDIMVFNYCFFMVGDLNIPGCFFFCDWACGFLC